MPDNNSASSPISVGEYLKETHGLGKTLHLKELATGTGVMIDIFSNSLSNGIWGYPVLLYICKFLSEPDNKLWDIYVTHTKFKFDNDPRTIKQSSEIIPRVKQGN